MLLSTGEAPATSFTNDGGTRGRTLGLWGSPFGGADEGTVAAVQRVTRQVLVHHGHLGPMVVRWLVDLPEARTLIRDGYAEAVARWTDLANGHPVASRAADALREVLSWAAGQQARFWGQPTVKATSDDGPPSGWLGAWSGDDNWTQLAILPTEVKGFLARQAFDPEAILQTWADRGWLLTEGRHRTRKVTVGARKVRCAVLTRAACDAVSGDADAG